MGIKTLSFILENSLRVFLKEKMLHKSTKFWTENWSFWAFFAIFALWDTHFGPKNVQKIKNGSKLITNFFN
jgi:hypothetical protein